MSTRGIITTQEGTGAPLRKSPLAEAEMVGAIPSGTEVDLLGYGDGWYLVSADGLQGYVAGSMIQALDGIDGLGKLRIFKKKNKGKTTATVTATPAVVKEVNTIKNSGGIASKLKAATAALAAKNNPKLQLTNAIRAAKKAGVTEAEIKEMASLNGIGSLLDTLKNAGNKVVNAAKKVVGAKEKVDTVKEALNQSSAPAAQTPAPAAQTPAPAAQQPVVVVQQPQTQNINPQNNTTMDDEKKSKIKKIAIAGAALVGVATVGVIIYKKSKKNTAASNGKGALNGVKKRRKKSRKSKKNTGNKMLHLS